MNIMLVGGISMMMRSLSIKLHKEGHRLYVLTGSRNPGNHYPHAFERYDFPYDSPSVEEVFRSVQPDVTILLGAFDGNFVGQDLKREAVRLMPSLPAGVCTIPPSTATVMDLLCSPCVVTKSDRTALPSRVSISLKLKERFPGSGAGVSMLTGASL